MTVRRLAASTAVLAVLAGGLSACGGDKAEEKVRHGKTEGVYVYTGGLKYQVQISRILNPFDFEDHDYIKGIANYDSRLARDEDWFGVFLRVFNQSDGPHLSASDFTIVDTTGKQFKPVRVDANQNVVAYRPLVVKPGDQIPLPNSLARENLTQGGLVLFKIPEPNFANRPLVLHIASPEGDPEATVDLDI